MEPNSYFTIKNPEYKDGPTVEQLEKEGYNFDIRYFFNKSFEIFKQHSGMLVGYTLLAAITLVASAFSVGMIPVAGIFLNSTIQLCILSGFFVVGKKIIYGESYEFNDFFKGFQFFIPFLLGRSVGLALIFLGLLILIIPGIYLGIAYTWMPLLIMFGGKEFWPALEDSRRIITKRWFTIFGFMLVIFLLNLAGALLLGIGLLITVPVSQLAILIAYDEVIGINNQNIQEKKTLPEV
ncbi:MAG: hypothetical protein ACOC31_06285 [Bacteroidota bacterium]